MRTTLDQDWLRRFRRGEDGAASDLHSFVERVCGRFRRELGDQWEDLVQESLAEAVTSLRQEKVAGIPDLGGWVWRICSSNALDRRRRRYRWTWVDSSVLDTLESESGIEAFERAADARRQRELVVGAASDRCRELWSRIIAGQGQAEIAAAMKMSPGALRVQLFRCREHARRAIAKSEERGRQGATSGKSA